MKILITGGTGFIGRYLHAELKQKGHQVYSLSNRDNNTKQNNFIQADITNRKKMLDIIPQFDMVYHLAGLLGTSELIKKAYQSSRINILGTINVLDGALKNRTKVVYITKPNIWLNTYSITKAAGESFVKMYYAEFGIPTISAKWFNVYGPHQSFHCQKAVPFFIRWALDNQNIEIWGDGNQTMDLIHAKDAVRATVLIAENSTLEGKTIDIGSGKETSVNQLAHMIKTAAGSKSKIVHLPMRPGETPNTKLKANMSHLDKMNFNCTISLEQGITETVMAYKQQLGN